MITDKEIEKGNKFLTKVLGWELTIIPTTNFGDLYIYERFKDGEVYDEISVEETIPNFNSENSYIPFYENWNLLMQAVEEIQINPIIQQYASIEDFIDETGNGVRMNVFGHFKHSYYWNIIDKKWSGVQYTCENKKEATFKAVIEIFEFVEKFL